MHTLGFFFFKQKTAYDMRISDWSSDVCSSDLLTDLLENLLADHRLEHAAAISGLNVMNGDPGIIECAKDGLGAKRSRRSVGIATESNHFDPGTIDIVHDIDPSSVRRERLEKMADIGVAVRIQAAQSVGTHESTRSEEHKDDLQHLTR